MFIKKYYYKLKCLLPKILVSQPKGFSLLEVLLVISISAMLFNFTIPRLVWFYQARQQKEQAKQLAQTIRLAQALSLAGYQDQSFGVYLDEDNRQYVIYQGPNYSNRLVAWGEIGSLKYFTSATSSFPQSDIHFTKNTLEPSQSGLISLTAAHLSQQIYISRLGLVEVK